MAGAYSVLDGPRQSSWTFSLPKYSEPIQHYSLEKITWHAGLPGDRKQDTSLIGNLTLVGKEHEGKKGEPWTENQLHWSAKIDVALRQLCPAFGANPPTLRLNQWEHNWLSATSCPSGRNPWSEKFALINEWEVEMLDQADKDWIRTQLTSVVAQVRKTLKEQGLERDKQHETLETVIGGSGGGLTAEEDMPKFIQLKDTQAIAIVDGNTKLQVRQELLSALYGPDLDVLEVGKADWDSIPDAHAGGSSGGLRRGDKVTLE